MKAAGEMRSPVDAINSQPRRPGNFCWYDLQKCFPPKAEKKPLFFLQSFQFSTEPNFSRTFPLPVPVPISRTPNVFSLFIFRNGKFFAGTSFDNLSVYGPDICYFRGLRLRLAHSVHKTVIKSHQDTV